MVKSEGGRVAMLYRAAGGCEVLGSIMPSCPPRHYEEWPQLGTLALDSGHTGPGRHWTHWTLNSGYSTSGQGD